ncbi:aminopeptidase N C-terminal domain-containing protein, partial [Mesorhizobium sp.]
ATVEDGVIHIRKRRHLVRFTGVAERPAVSLNRGFSAPITLSVEQRADDQFFLAGHDSDSFARWQAFNTLLTDALIATFRQVLGGTEPVFTARLAELAGKIAVDETLEPAYRALALSLPSEADIARDIGKGIDPDAIFAAREALALAIAKPNRDSFSDLYERLADKGPFSPNASSAGRRAMRNILLDYLALLPEGAALAASHFRSASNMTDRAAALTVLAHRHAGSRQAVEALAAFEAKYGGDALVMDKWFQIQAGVPGPRTVEAVRALTGHPAFSMANPNRVRALVGTFSSANQTGFHRADGEGYRFFTETVLEVEKRNPQLAARLATALRSWRSLEPKRQAKAREALLAMAAADKLSADLRDIVERTLA